MMIPSIDIINKTIEKLWTTKESMTSPARLDALKDLCIRYKNKEGAFVECGVAKGGALALMRLLSNDNKQIWGFDSFRGMPELTQEDNGSGVQFVGVGGMDSLWL